MALLNNRLINLYDVINKSKIQLLKSNILNAQKEIEWFINYKFKISFYDIKLNRNVSLNKNQIKIFDDFIHRRVLGEPFQYILGLSSFCGYDFVVNRHTLIPRPETETMIKIAKEKGPFNDALDIGTGSANLSVVLSLQKIVYNIDALDISKKALQIAKINKEKYNIKNIQLIKANIFDFIFDKSYDLIISNPPYISQEEYKKLDKHIQHYEPEIALTDNSDGMQFYNFFAKNLSKILRPKGIALIEIGLPKTQQKIQKIFEKYNFKFLWHKDLNGDYRVVELYL